MPNASYTNRYGQVNKKLKHINIFKSNTKIMKIKIKKWISLGMTIFFLTTATSINKGSLSKQNNLQEQNSYENQIYDIGTQIAEGVSASLAIGMSSIDPSLEYEMETSNDKFSAQGHTWPIIDVLIKIQSQKLNNPQLTYVLLLEIDNATNTIVGTVKNIRSDGKRDEALEGMNNTMFIETSEGTEQVQFINGELQTVF